MALGISFERSSSTTRRLNTLFPRLFNTSKKRRGAFWEKSINRGGHLLRNYQPVIINGNDSSIVEGLKVINKMVIKKGFPCISIFQ